METLIPDLVTIQPDVERLQKSNFSLQEKFIESFSDPLPKGIGKYVFLLFIVFTLTNIVAAFVLLIYYLAGPRKTKHSVPRKDTAEEWFLYAEKCLKYSFKDEIMEGYTRALELEPENGQILLRYNQFLASEFVLNKTPATGQPVGIIKKIKSDNPYESYKELLDGWKTSHPNETFNNPLKPNKKEQVFAIAAWLAFDTKHYADCIELGEYSFTIGEFTDSKKDKEKRTELLILLSVAYVEEKKHKQAIKYLVKAISTSHKNFKELEAMGWELLGEYFNENKQVRTAESCYLLAQKKDVRRWISAFRLFKIYSKIGNMRKSEFYKQRYIRMQKELSPL